MIFGWRVCESVSVSLTGLSASVIMETYFILKESGSYPSGWLLDGVKMAERCSLAIPTTYYTIIKTLKFCRNAIEEPFFCFPKNLSVDLFLAKTHLLSSQDVLMDWNGVMFLSDSHSDGTHSLQGIHCWDTDALLNLMKKQTHLHLGWPEGEHKLLLIL